MSKPAPNRAVLGVYVAPETIEAVLIRQAGDHAEVVQRFVRQRAARGELAMTKDLAMALPGLKTAEDADYTLEVGDGSSASLLPSEVSRLGGAAAKGARAGAPAKGAPAKGAQAFAPQLKEILQECHALGYEHADVAFCVAPPEVAYVELPAPADDAGAPAEKGARADREARKGERAAKKDAAEAGGVSAADRKRLLALLPQHYAAPFQEDRVAFLPLGVDRERRRYLAVVADPAEPVSATLNVLREQDSAFAPEGRLLDAEVPLYTALLARSLAPGPEERTAIVRVGANDTLVLFLEGARLRHLERLRSLTAFDAAETVCSRVLLQQDEKRIGELHTLFLLTAGRAEPLLESFRRYYPDAAVESMGRALSEGGLRLPEDDDVLLKAAAVPALAVALRQLQGWDVEPAVNLLPRQLQRRKRAGAFAWHTALALLLALAAVGVGVWRYQAKAAEVEAIRAEHRANPVPVPVMNPDVLQARVDSLDLAYATYTRALNVLDSLLVGSDKWISTFERVSRATAAEPDTWIDNFAPQGGASANLSGHSLSRLAIVDLSRRLNGAIVQLTYQDIGERRVFNYEMTIPIPNEMPRAALYLRNVAPGDAEPEGPQEVHPARHAH